MTEFCPRCGAQLEQHPFEGKPRRRCPRCAFVVFADPKVAASVLIMRDGRLLLVRRAIEPARGLWCFPGGYVDYAEDPEHAAARECLEETGLVINNLRLLDVAFNGTVIVISYSATVSPDAEPLAGDDADTAGWFDAADLPPLAFWTMRRAIKAWSKQTNEPTNQRTNKPCTAEASAARSPRTTYVPPAADASGPTNKEQN